MFNKETVYKCTGRVKGNYKGRGKNIWDINYNQIVNIFSTQFFTVKKWVKEEAESIPKGSNQGTVKMWENI